MSDHRWTEGICGDGSAILYDGVPVSISCVLETLNDVECRMDAMQRQIDALLRLRDIHIRPVSRRAES